MKPHSFLLHCDLCHKNICNDCEAKHVSELSKPHEIVPFKERGSTPICQKHYCKIIDLYCTCTDCDIPLCVQRASSKEHQHHKTVKGKRGRLKLDLEELDIYIYPKYQEIETHIRYVKAYINKNSQKLTQTLETRRKVWNRNIDIIINRMISESNDVDSKHLAALTKQEAGIKRTISEISQAIDDLKKVLESNDDRPISAYISKNVEFKQLPPNLRFLLQALHLKR